MPPRNSPPSRVATSVVTPVCRSTRVAPQKTIENSTAMTETRNAQASQNAIGRLALSLVPDARTRRGPARRSRATMTQQAEGRQETQTPRQATARGAGQHHRTDEGRDHRPDVRASDPQPGEPPAGTSEQGVRVPQQRPGAEPDQQRCAQGRPERRPDSKDDDGDGERRHPGAADGHLAQAPIERRSQEAR